jgi:DNA repair protein RadC
MTQISEIEIRYKRSAGRAPIITNIDKAIRVCRRLFDVERIDHKEFVYCLYLSTSKKLLSTMLIAEGGTKGVLFDMKIIFQAALKINADSIIISHNHPSGNLKPSPGDIKVTKTIKAAGKVLDITLIDHVIIARKGHYSFAQNGKL